MKTVVRQGIYTQRLWLAKQPGCLPLLTLTISESRARPGSRVGGASLCLSTASSTSTKRHLGSRVGSFSSVLKDTVSWESVSQRRLCFGGGVVSESSSRARETASTILSNRCRPVMHCAAFTLAYLSPPLCSSDATCSAICSAIRGRSCSAMLDFPVASVPCRTRLRQGAAEGCERH